MNEDDLGRQTRDKLWHVGGELAEIRENLRERKTERLQLRVTPTEKREVDTVTELLGVSASDYLMHLHRRAMKDLERKNERHSRRQPAGDHERAEREPEEPDSSRESRNREDARPNLSRRVKPRKRRRGEEDDGLAGVGAEL